MKSKVKKEELPFKNTDVHKFVRDFKKNNNKFKDGHYRYAKSGKKRLIKSSKEQAEFYIRFLSDTETRVSVL